RAIQRRQVIVGHEAQQPDVGGEGRLFGGGVNGFGAVPITAAKDKLPMRACGGFEFVEGGYQAHMIFGRMFEARDVKEKWRLNLMALSDCLTRFDAVAREKALMVQAVMDDLDAIGLDLEKFTNIARRIFADGDDGVLALSEPAGDDAAVEHARAAVFLGHAKRREIMDGGDERAGPLPEQAAIAGHVQDIKLEAAGERGQGALMPENIFYGRTKMFGDRQDSHPASCEIEQRQIFLEHEKDEAMLARIRQQRAQEGEEILGNAGFAALNDGS